ncbi:MAG: ABC transporter substrate-binding protein [Desulfobaccales bacterium]
MMLRCGESGRIHGKVRSPRGHLILSAKDLHYSVCSRPAGFRRDPPVFRGADGFRKEWLVPKLLNQTLALLALISLLAVAVPAAAAEPEQAVKAVINQVLDLLNNPAYAGPAQEQRRLQMAKQLVDPHFDYREMAKRTLGATWNNLSNGQRDEFVSLFSELLEADYAGKILRYIKNVRIDYTGQNIDGGYAEVRTMVVLPNDRIPITYHLLSVSGDWMVYDVVIDGVGLMSNYRFQFSRVIQQSSYNALVDRLRTRVSEVRAGG